MSSKRRGRYSSESSEASESSDVQDRHHDHPTKRSARQEYELYDSRQARKHSNKKGSRRPQNLSRDHSVSNDSGLKIKEEKKHKNRLRDRLERRYGIKQSSSGYSHESDDKDEERCDYRKAPKDIKRSTKRIDDERPSTSKSHRHETDSSGNKYQGKQTKKGKGRSTERFEHDRESSAEQDKIRSIEALDNEHRERRRAENNRDEHWNDRKAKRDKKRDQNSKQNELGSYERTRKHKQVNGQMNSDDGLTKYSEDVSRARELNRLSDDTLKQNGSVGTSKLPSRTLTKTDSHVSKTSTKFIVLGHLAAVISVLEALIGIALGFIVLSNSYHADLKENDYKISMSYVYLALHSSCLVFNLLLFYGNQVGQPHILVFWIVFQICAGITFVGGTFLYVTTETTLQDNLLDPIVPFLFYTSVFLSFVLLKFLTVPLVVLRYKNLALKPTDISIPLTLARMQYLAAEEGRLSNQTKGTAQVRSVMSLSFDASSLSSQYSANISPPRSPTEPINSVRSFHSVPNESTPDIVASKNRTWTNERASSKERIESNDIVSLTKEIEIKENASSVEEVKWTEGSSTDQEKESNETDSTERIGTSKRPFKQGVERTERQSSTEEVIKK